MKTWFKYLQQGLASKLPEDRIAGTKGYGGMRSNLKNLHPYLVMHWRKGLLGFLLILMASLFGFAPPLISRYLIDKVILDQQLELLAAAIILLIGFLAAEKLARMLEEFYFARLEQRITLDIHRDLIAKVLRLPKSFFDDHQTGYLMSRLTEDVEGIRWFFSSTVVHIVGNIIRFAGGIVFLFYLEWRLSLIVLILLPALGFCIRFFSGKMHTLSHLRMEQNADVSSKLQESLSGAPLIKAYASEDRAQHHLMSALRGVLRISLQQVIVGSLANLVVGAMPGLARALALAVGAVWVIKGQWTLGSLLAFQAYLAYVFSPAQFLASANLQLQKALAALERVSALFDIVVEENMGAGEKIQSLQGEIEFKNVSFSYNGSRPILEDLSFHIRPGEKIAIVGPSGVGKTTLLSLILRFYRPTFGEIYFDGRPASAYEVSSLRQRVGYVSQQPRLVAGPLMDNLRYGNPEASRAEVIQATKISGIHDFIESLPAGYDTEINENGINLSEGQKQRLAIARALIKSPDILVFDEPTAALDSITETSIFDVLPDLIRKKTMLVVAHRISTIRDADRIFLLDENRLIAAGSHQSLVEKNNCYRSMVALQQTPAGHTFASDN